MKKTLLIVLPPLLTIGCENFQDSKIDGVIWMVLVCGVLLIDLMIYINNN